MVETYQLLKVPRANLHVALVVIQALGEVASIGLTAGSVPLRRLSLGDRGGSSSLGGRRRGSSEESGDSSSHHVSDGGSDGDTSSGGCHLEGSY